jgi:cephalosporin hydroxylase
MIINDAMEIPGQTDEKQHLWYQKIIEWFHYPPAVLEIGCAWGRSSWAWLDCMNMDGSYLEILDNWSYSKNFKQLNGFKLSNETYYKFISDVSPNYDQKEILLYNLKQHKNFQKIKKIHTGVYSDASKHYDIVYLDDDHSQKNVSNELEHFNGVPVMCGDDFENTHPGVIKAICKFYHNNFNKYKLYIDPDARFWALKRTDM